MRENIDSEKTLKYHAFSQVRSAKKNNISIHNDYWKMVYSAHARYSKNKRL